MVAALGLLGCGFIGYEPRRDADGTQATRDGFGADAQGSDSTNDVSGETDSVAPTQQVSEWLDSDTLALFEFSPADPLVDSVGSTRLVPVFFQDEVLLADGPRPGTSSVAFNGEAAPLVLPHDDRWNLVTGSVDFFIRIQACAEGRNEASRGVLSRDAFSSDNPGHFRVMLIETCGLIIRLQSDVASAGVSSLPLALDTWTHIGVNFGLGGFELWVDGVLADAEPEWVTGIAGNENPWLIGADTNLTDEGSVDGWSQPLLAGQVALLRISRIRRDFSLKFLGV